jgi:hypothetical protein
MAGLSFMPETFHKDDAGKPELALITLLPEKQLITIARVVDYGAQKYSRDNWKKGHFAAYANAALRHIWARLRGETLDPESGLPHLAHAASCLLFLMWYDDTPESKR